MKKLIAQGAEAKIYDSGSEIIKERVSKSYRLKEIDLKLRKTRTKAEAKLLSEAARVGVNVPEIIDFDLKSMVLKLKNINGKKFRDWLESGSKATSKECEKRFRELGRMVRNMHHRGIIHGDLTTSNMILKDEKLYLIDFGLGQFSDRLEDKAVDIHLLKECLKSKHHQHWKSLWKAFLAGYKSEEVLERMKKVEARGRYKGLGQTARH